MGGFPWDILKAETLRILCRDLGFSQAIRKDIMISFLTTVEESGLEEAFKILPVLSPQKSQEKPSAPASPTTPNPGKRIVISDYNTRHRDKRKRVSDPGPGPSRPKIAKLQKAPEVDANGQIVRRKRGRPPKNKPKPVSQTSLREVFDGVEMPVVYLGNGKGKGKAREESEHSDEALDAGSIDELPGDDGRGSREESSLADSNKENEVQVGEIDETVLPDTADGDEGDNPSTHSVIVQMLMPPADEDMDAEGEAVNETDDVVGLHQHPVQLPEPHHTHELTTDDVVNIEQVLMSVVSNGDL